MTVVAVGPAGPAGAAHETDGPVKVVRVGRWAGVAKFDVAPGLTATLRRMLADPPDVWHLHAPNVTMTLAALALPRLRPLVITHHADIDRRRPLSHLVRPFETRLYRRAALLLATSPPYLDGSPRLTR